jgi:hypothetical protein
MKNMSTEESEVFERVMGQALGALVIFRTTGRKEALIASCDQLEMFTKEFGTRIIFINADMTEKENS